MEEMLQERYDLAKERIAGILEESILEEKFTLYFKNEAEWMLHLFDTHRLVAEGLIGQMSLTELQELNKKHYDEILGDHYKTSYANPTVAIERVGKEFGAFFAALHAELRKGIVCIYNGQDELFIASAEMFLEIYSAFICEWEESKLLPAYDDVKNIYYWYICDYAELRADVKFSVLHPEENQIYQMVCNTDLTDLRYLYRYGNYISDNEFKVAAFLNGLPEETIATMANTFTEGYRIGFEVTGKDISKKKFAGVGYNIGFERVVRRSFENLEKIGMKGIFAIESGGFWSTPANRQYDYDHKDDSALFVDRQYFNRRLETAKNVFEKYKEDAALYGGPAFMEEFGETPFDPEVNRDAIRLDDKQQKLTSEFGISYRQLQSGYINPEERSYTIIAFPLPEIGDRFEEIFSEIIRINTLDYMLYRDIQQKLIDVLDTAEYAEVKGGNGNRTNMKVMLRVLKDPAKETKFENCVADVNIPVGEVFTSPVLTGTEGTLHVSRVFLNELEYRDLEIHFKDGMISDYRCGNFEDEEEGKRYIRENIMNGRETLPIGEFAIGTNTTAYVMAEKYDIGSKLPILIAEKMGPHFAVGDTCYSYAEDVAVYNPDGKEIVARDNEVSAKRKEDPYAAYFGCHTDITIPYHELEELAAVRADGSRVVLIKNGRFVLPGCEELNKPFED